MSVTPQQVIESLTPIQELVEQAAAVRPIMLKTADGWEIFTATDILFTAISVRDEIWHKMFESLGGLFDE